MSAVPIKVGPFSQADGPQEVDLKSEGWKPWHEISISITDAIGDPLVPTSGTIEVAAMGIGSDVFEPFVENLYLPAGERRYAPFYSNIDKLRFTPIDLEANARYNVIVISNREH